MIQFEFGHRFIQCVLRLALGLAFDLVKMVSVSYKAHQVWVRLSLCDSSSSLG